MVRTRISIRTVAAIVLAMAPCALAQPATTATTRSADALLDFGAEGLVMPPATIVNSQKPRTAQLLGEAYRRKDPLVWKRVQLVSELGLTRLPEAAPYVAEAMTDPEPAVRAEAARAAASIGDRGSLEMLANLTKDADADVRREALLAAASLAR